MYDGAPGRLFTIPLLLGLYFYIIPTGPFIDRSMTMYEPDLLLLTLPGNVAPEKL